MCVHHLPQITNKFCQQAKDTKIFIMYREKFALMCPVIQGHLAVSLQGRHVITGDFSLRNWTTVEVD